jgi:hypothetical protein
MKTIEVNVTAEDIGNNGGVPPLTAAIKRVVDDKKITVCCLIEFVLFTAKNTGRQSEVRLPVAVRKWEMAWAHNELAIKKDKDFGGISFTLKVPDWVQLRTETN